MSEQPLSEAGFSTSADVYERGQPSYPDDTIRRLVAMLGVGAGQRVLDLAAGTGKPSSSMRAEFAPPAGHRLPFPMPYVTELYRCLVRDA